PPLPLDTCVALALGKNFTVRIQKFSVEQARDAVTIAKAGYDPTLSLQSQKSQDQAAATTSTLEGTTNVGRFPTPRPAPFPFRKKSSPAAPSRPAAISDATKPIPPSRCSTQPTTAMSRSPSPSRSSKTLASIIIAQPSSAPSSACRSPILISRARCSPSSSTSRRLTSICSSRASSTKSSKTASA
ncbi:MAG: TolC family protein, partial [Verrucomicrobiota bacterium]|nr:TolC family protein [Verrucomicrobiota bacterium]